jgi:hypothetical protein
VVNHLLSMHKVLDLIPSRSFFDFLGSGGLLYFLRQGLTIYPGTHNLPASASQVLGLQVCTPHLA